MKRKIKYTNLIEAIILLLYPLRHFTKEYINMFEWFKNYDYMAYTFIALAIIRIIKFIRKEN